MWTRGFIFLIGAVYIFTGILDPKYVLGQDIYVAELMVESNVTLEAETILTILKGITKLTVTDEAQNSHDVIFEEVVKVAECLIVGIETSCNCSAGYIWSNEVCDNHQCCRETTCNKNVSHITPLCIPKVAVYINGSVTLNQGTWDASKKTQLQSKFEILNGFESLNITSETTTFVEFEVGLSVKFVTSKLQEDIINTLQSTLLAFIRVDTDGMVYIESPQKKVCYHSTPILKCQLEEGTDASGWNLSTTFERFELNDGSVVELNKDCATTEMKSCVGVTLTKVTSAWEGTYECGFTKGLVRHTAKAYLSVARLPDNILLTTNPITGDCSEEDPSGSVIVDVTTTILKKNNSYEFKWIYNKVERTAKPVVDEKNVKYTFPVTISCTRVETGHQVQVTFKNDINQTKTASVTIPVIYAGEKFCEAEASDGVLWPKTPNGDTAVSHECPPGRVGYRERTCENSVWADVFDVCVNEELNKISNAANSFLEGMGATEEVADNIFSDLEKNTANATGETENPADLLSSINILETMEKGSENVELTGKVLPKMVSAASNMVNKTWSSFNTSVLHTVSANYLKSLEGLVKNIGVSTNSTNSTDFKSPNIDLKYCSGTDCNVTVFGIGVRMNQTVSIMKTIAVKNLMSKLKNTYKNTEITPLLVSNTAEMKRGKRPNERAAITHNVNIVMDFPVEVGKKQKPHCVFWNTIKNDFDSMGCKQVTNGPANSSKVICECNHLTSFSVLMARGDVSNPVLDVITYVGLAVSIVSLVIFLLIEYLVWGVVIKTKLSHYRHTAMVNIALFLLLADICFLASTEPSKLSESTCLALTICKHLFFLAKFCWMFCLSAMLVHQLIFVFNPLRKKVFMYLSSIVGYIVPILIVGSSYVYYKYTQKPYFNTDLCWLTYDRLLVGSLHSFLLPIGAILLSNIFSMGVVIVTLLKSSKNDSSKTDEKDTAKSIIKVILVLAPVFGVTWSIGFCLVVFNSAHPAYPFFNYTFTIVNSFQGLFVLFTGFMAEQKVKDEMYRIVTGNKKGSSDSTKNLTSTTYTKDK